MIPACCSAATGGSVDGKSSTCCSPPRWPLPSAPGSWQLAGDVLLLGHDPLLWLGGFISPICSLGMSQPGSTGAGDRAPGPAVLAQPHLSAVGAEPRCWGSCSTHLLWQECTCPPAPGDTRQVLPSLHPWMGAGGGMLLAGPSSHAGGSLAEKQLSHHVFLLLDMNLIITIHLGRRCCAGDGRANCQDL